MCVQATSYTLVITHIVLVIYVPVCALYLVLADT